MKSLVASSLPVDSPHRQHSVGSSSQSSVVSSTKQIYQPSIFEERKLGSDESVIVAEWEYSKFVWWSRFIDEELPEVYLELLDVLDVDSEDCSLDIEGFYCYLHKRDPGYRCDVKQIFLPKVSAGKYHPYRSVKHRRRASSHTLERLEFLEEECRKQHVNFDYVLKIDLTLPKQISEMWDNEKVERCIRKAVRDFLSELHRELFGSRSSQFGAISNHHYWATNSPLTPHRHIHLTLPNVCYNSKAGTFHRFRPWVEADLVKEVWQRVLKKNALWIDVPDSVKPDCYVGYVKFEDRNKASHRLSYCCRKPVEDLVGNLGSVDLDDFDEEFARFLLDFTPRVVNLGFMTNLKRWGYSPKSNLVKCPICGGEMYIEKDDWGSAILYDRPPPKTPHLFRNRVGFWLKM